MNRGMKKTAMSHSGHAHQELEPWEPVNPRCPPCQGALGLSQPDMNRGDALLGVCTGCPTWFLIEGQSGAMTDLCLSDWLNKTSPIALSELRMTGIQRDYDRHDRIGRGNTSLGSRP